MRTAADLADEPDDGLRRELHDGILHVHPPSSPDHAWQVGLCAQTLFAAQPDGIVVLTMLGVHVGLRRFYVPDVVAVHQDAPFRDYGYEPQGVLLVVEVVSEPTVTMDRLAKPAVYAEQGIPYFWRIDDGPTLQTFRLDPATGSYVRDAELGPGTRAELATPWQLGVDTAELVIPHRR